MTNSAALDDEPPPIAASAATAKRNANVHADRGVVPIMDLSLKAIYRFDRAFRCGRPSSASADHAPLTCRDGEVSPDGTGADEAKARAPVIGVARVLPFALRRDALEEPIDLAA